MKLYQVTFDGDNDFVEADSFGDAIAVWTAWLIERNPESWEEGEQPDEPEQVVLVSDKPVIRVTR